MILRMSLIRLLEGKPEHFAEYYNASGADELVYIDAVASLYDRNSLVDIINRTAKKIFISLTVGITV
jgi:cyclase